MGLTSKKEIPSTSISEKDNIFVLHHKDTKKKGSIDKIDLELDYIQQSETINNPFPIDIFPKSLQEIIVEANDKYQFSLDYLGAGILAATSTVIGNSHKVLVKHGWLEKVNLYTVIVGRPGDSKSHALNFCFKPIHENDNNLFQDYLSQQIEYENNIKDTSENKSGIRKPFLKKHLISDFTPEALIQAHFNNPKGLCIYVDELNGWLKNFNRYNNSGEAETYLSLWSGTTISIDRASGKSIRIEDPFIGVIGSTQITVLKEFSKEGRNVNGFMDRLLFVYPENPKTLKWNIAKVDNLIIHNYFTIISNLIKLKNNKKDVTEVPIEKKAKEYLFTWQNNRPETYFFDYERSIDIKLQQYVIRFALIIQLLFYSTEKKSKELVELFAIKSGIKLFNYYFINAVRVRNETIRKNYLETLTEMQKNILDELPKKFTTGEGLKIACKIIDGKKRISERQFKSYLKDNKLFKRITHGNYEKLL